MPMRRLLLAHSPGATPALLTALTREDGPLVALVAATHPAATAAVRVAAGLPGDVTDPADLLTVASPSAADLWLATRPGTAFTATAATWSLANPFPATSGTAADWWGWLTELDTLPDQVRLGAAAHCAACGTLQASTLHEVITLVARNHHAAAAVAAAATDPSDARVIRAAARTLSRAGVTVAAAAEAVSAATTPKDALAALLAAGPDATAVARVLTRPGQDGSRAWARTAVTLAPTVAEDVRAAAMGTGHRPAATHAHVGRRARTLPLALATARAVRYPLALLLDAAFRTGLPAGALTAVLDVDDPAELPAHVVAALTVHPDATVEDRARARDLLTSTHPAGNRPRWLAVAAAGATPGDDATTGGRLPWQAIDGQDDVLSYLAGAALARSLPAVHTPERAATLLALLDTFAGTVDELVTTAVAIAG